MDRNTVTGLVLIFLVFLAWVYWTMPSQEEIQKQRARQDSIAAVRTDSLAASQRLAEKDTGRTKSFPAATTTDTTAETEKGEVVPQQKPSAEMGVFSQASLKDTSRITIQTPLYHTTFTNVGAGPVSFTLKKYQTWDEEPVQLINSVASHSAYNVGFMTTNNLNIDTDQLLFQQVTSGNSLNIGDGETRQLKYALKIDDHKSIVYTYTFHGDSYEIDLDISFKGMNNVVAGDTFELGWVPSLNLTEKNRTKDAAMEAAYVFSGGEKEQLKLSEPGSKKKVYSGTIQWVSTRTKWFTQIIKPKTPTVGARIVGDVNKTAGAVNAHHYKAYVKAQIPGNETASFQMYIGPLSYKQLSSYDETAYDMVKIGYSFMNWFARPLVELIIIPFFSFLGKYMSMGFVIILFSIAIKLVLWPLTHKSFRSMAAMKELQPKMNEIKEKYKDDPQKQQKAIMKLYKEGNVNPLGSCLPQLLQLPILYTLFFYIRNSFLLRQQPFLWANDLSVPDTIIHLPFQIPFLGAGISGFALLMAIAMVFQFKYTGGMGGMGAGGGSAGMAKMMQYFFPIFLFFIFNNFAAALCLYYLFYNVANMIQQLIIQRQMEQEKNGEVVKATA